MPINNGKTIANQTSGEKTTLTGTEKLPISGNQYVQASNLAQLAESKAVVMWHDQSVKTAGNAFTTSIDTQHAYNHVVHQSAAANGDTWTNGFVCQAGTYTFNFLCTTDADRGKLDVFVDNVQIGTILDFYAASTTRNVVKTIASIAVTAGYHTLKGVVNGKNASSSGYTIALTKIWLTPSAY